MKLEPDHFLIAAPSLEAGVDLLLEQTGLRPASGGSHPGQGTRNALVALDDGIYLEVIVPDPDQETITPLSKYLMELENSGLHWWSIRCENIIEVSQLVRRLGISYHSPVTGSRMRCDGTIVHWKLLMPNDPSYGSSLPFFIEWSDMKLHPTSDLQSQAQCVKVEISTPKAESLAPYLSGVEFVHRAEENIRLTLNANGKRVEICSPGLTIPGIGAFFSVG